MLFGGEGGTQARRNEPRASYRFFQCSISVSAKHDEKPRGLNVLLGSSLASLHGNRRAGISIILRGGELSASISIPLRFGLKGRCISAQSRAFCVERQPVQRPVHFAASLERRLRRQRPSFPLWVGLGSGLTIFATVLPTRCPVGIITWLRALPPGGAFWSTYPPDGRLDR